MEADNLTPFGQCPIGMFHLTLTAYYKKEQSPCNIVCYSDRYKCRGYFIEIKPGEGIMNFVDGVIDSSRYYVVRLKVRVSILSR